MAHSTRPQLASQPKMAALVRVEEMMDFDMDSACSSVAAPRTVQRHPASKKWFAVIMDVPENKLGLPGAASIDILNIRCDPRMTGSLLAETGFLPAYHMSKSTWISILLNGSAPDDTIIPLLEFSYDSVAPKRRKR